jgi:hypothetical protein
MTRFKMAVASPGSKGAGRTRRPLVELFSLVGPTCKECRLHALTCERLAQRSTSPIVKGAYADLAKKWLKVADDIQAVINARAEPESQRRTA